MKEWTREIEIEAPIEHIWELFDGSVEKMQLIMPQVVGHEPVKVTKEKVGTVYRQQYKEGKRVEEYDVETLEYLDEPAAKKLKVGFTLANMFEITARYELTKLAEDKTKFRYTATNKALKWFIKPFLMFASDKVVITFLDRVKQVAESTYKK